MNYDRKLSLKSTAEIQQDIDLIRLAYRERDMQPLNRRMLNELPWLALGMVIGCIVAAFLYL
jgi:hypothetical protein